MRWLLGLVVALLLCGSVTTTALAAKHKQVCRDAKTGQYVSVGYAKKYPGLTVCEAKQ
jgi:hypothetical protein